MDYECGTFASVIRKWVHPPGRSAGVDFVQRKIGCPLADIPPAGTGRKPATLTVIIGSLIDQILSHCSFRDCHVEHETLQCAAQCPARLALNIKLDVRHDPADFTWRCDNNFLKPWHKLRICSRKITAVTK